MRSRETLVKMIEKQKENVAKYKSLVPKFINSNKSISALQDYAIAKGIQSGLELALNE